MAVGPEYLDACIRDYLNTSAPRTMVVLEPLKVVITNLPNEKNTVDVPDFPSAAPGSSSSSSLSTATHLVTLSSVVYIERSDFRDGAKVDKDYRRLTSEQPVGLRHAGLVIKVEKVVRSPEGNVRELHVTCTPADRVDKKPKAFIHWVSEPRTVEVRLYEHLFMHEHPEDSTEVSLKRITYLPRCNKCFFALFSSI
jgi:glutaminyl-tRNA synthetase